MDILDKEGNSIGTCEPFTKEGVNITCKNVVLNSCQNVSDVKENFYKFPDSDEIWSIISVPVLFNSNGRTVIASTSLDVVTFQPVLD